MGYQSSVPELLGGCVHCGANLPLGARFCPFCGKPVDLWQMQTGGASTGPTPATEHKVVTILFADFAGFTTFLREREAEEVHDWLGSIWSRVDAIIAAHGGTVTKHIGDAIMALFGDRQAREGDPVQAVRAGLAIQAFMGEFEVKGTQGHLPMRIGIHTGRIVLETTGSTREFRATGDAINLASHLEQSAPPGEVMISHDTFRAVYGHFHVTSQPPLVLKGISEPLKTYLVCGAKPRAVTRLLRDIEGVSTEMVARGAELELLQNTFLKVLEQGRAQVVTILGEAGIGKSRLLQAFQIWADLLPQRYYLFLGQATADMVSRPYAVMRDLFATRFEIQDSDSPTVAREKLEAGLVALVSKSAEAATWPADKPRKMAHFVGQLLGLEFPGSPYLRGLPEDPERLRHQAFSYMQEFFTAISRGTVPTQERPKVRGVLLVVEDIHWCDDGSMNNLEQIAKAGEGTPLMVICLARPTLLERRPNWGEGFPAHLFLRVDPLSREESKILVQQTLRKANSIPAGLSELVIETADGNPFYIEEMIKMLIDQKVIIPGPEVWEIQIDRLRAAPVPVTLAGVLQARLDCLSPPERAILQRASVIGRVFWDGALESMGPAQGPSFAGDPQGDGMLSKGEIDRTLTDLRSKELISPREASAFAGSTEYVFKHELLRNAAYESLLKRSRRGHHGQVADWLIQQSGERSAEFAGQVATHLAHAGRLAEAAEWYGRAGKQACAGYEPAMAIEYLHKALELLPREQTQTTGANRLEWLKSLGESLCAQARFDEAREMFVQMRCLAEESGHLVAQARAWNGLAFVQERRADNRASVAAAEKAEELARRAGESGYQELVRAMHYKGWALYRLADWKGVLRLARQSQALCVGLGDRHRLATSLKLLGVVYLQRGNFAKADECFRNGLGLYGEFDDRRNSAAMWSNLGESARLRGDFGAAVGFYEKALAISRQIGSRESEMIYLSNLSGARLGLHQFAQAEEALRELIPLAETRTSTMLSEAFSFLCAACLGQQKPAEALKAARRALALGRQSGNELDVGIAWRMLGRASARIKLAGLIPPTGESGEGAPLDPEACFVESVTRFKKLNLITEEARTLRAWAAFDLREGRTEEGLRKAAEAKRLLSRLGMSPELETSVRSPYETH